MTETPMGNRIIAAKGRDSFPVVSAKLAQHGIVIGGAGIHKWAKGGEVPERSLLAFCKIYDVSPAWIRYGIRFAEQPGIIAIAEKLAQLSQTEREKVLSFIDGMLAAHSETEAPAIGSSSPESAIFHLTGRQLSVKTFAPTEKKLKIKRRKKIINQSQAGASFGKDNTSRKKR